MIKKKKFKPGTEIDNPIVFSSIAGQSEKINDQKNVIKSNLFIFWLILNFILIIISGRVFYLQVIKGNYYQKVAEENRIRTVEVKAPRGLIVDRGGEILASNIPSFDLVVVPSEMSENFPERKKVYSSIAREIELEEQMIESEIEKIDKKIRKKYIIKEGINYEKALVLTEKLQKIQGLYLEKTARRKYQDGEIFSSILGYTGKITEGELKQNSDYSLTDYIGKNGLEYVYEKELKGKNGQLRMEVDSNGEIKEELGISPPVSGDKIVLNIDAKIQRKAVEALKKVLEVNDDASGAAFVALDPRDGSVLALASLPGYDNNLFTEGINKKDYDNFFNNPQKPMLNRAVAGEYPPGSVYKPILASIGLEEEVINSNTILNCPGVISRGAWSFRDWKTHGVTDLNKAIAESCNVFFYAVGGGWGGIEGVGVNKMSKYSKYFGLGSLTGVDLPWESSGTVPSKDWKLQEIGDRWYIGDTYHMSIGQGFLLTTPLQMASAISAIANEGVLYEPRVVKKIVKPDGRESETSSKVIRENFISSENFRKVKEAMKETVLSGSGRNLSNMENQVAGKTGTAQFGGNDKTHAWFASFAPFDDPEIVTVVLVEAGGEGHDWAVPVTEQVLRTYFSEEEEEVDWQRIKNLVDSRG